MKRLHKHFFPIIFIIMVSVLALQGSLTLQPKAAHAMSLATLNPIQQENNLAGTTSWELAHPAPLDTKNHTYDQAIEGYASLTSATSGNTVNFSVNTKAATFTADIYRLGWYGGKGAILKQTIASVTGHSYAIPTPNAQTGLIQAKWPVAFSVKIPASWVSGMYIVKLTNKNTQAYQSYIPFAVKSSRSSQFQFIYSVNTDEAYNNWGGASLYEDNTGKLPQGRALKVSFDRPFEQGYGSGELFNWDIQMIRWLEQNGYDVSYISEVDLHTSSTVLMNHMAALVVGHAEYWSKAMRDHLEAAVGSGVNLGVFGANTMYWQVRYEASSSSVANRVIVCYRDTSLDPLYGTNNGNVTVRFRDAPLNRPEQTLLGSMYGTYFDPGSSSGYPLVPNVQYAATWIFDGTSLQSGDSIPGVVGNETDTIYDTYPEPATLNGGGVDIVAASPVPATAVDSTDNPSNAVSTMYTAPSGARVFNAASLQWSWGLNAYTTYGAPNIVSSDLQTITANILANFQTGPAT